MVDIYPAAIMHNPRAPGLSVHQSTRLLTLYLPLFSHEWTALSQANDNPCQLMSLLLLMISYLLYIWQQSYEKFLRLIAFCIDIYINY